MSAIAAALGGSKGTLWSYFPSKEELFTAVIDHVSTMFRAELTEILDPCGDLKLTLKTLCLRFQQKVTAPNAIALHRLVVAEASRFPEIGRIFYERAPRLTTMLLADFLSGAMARGQLRQDDPVFAAQVLISLSYVRVQQQLLMGLAHEITPAQQEDEAERALRLFLRAYGTEGEAAKAALKDEAPSAAPPITPLS